MPRLAFEVELEFGSEVSRGAGRSDQETYLTSEINLEYSLSEKVTVFAEIVSDLSFENEDDTRMRNANTEFERIGLKYKLDELSIDIGKITPQFGYAKDADLGYFGDNFIQDYELESGYGVLAEFDLGNKLLTASVFSIHDRGEKLERVKGVALQYEHAYAGGVFHLGARSLFPSNAEAANQLGLAFGLSAEHRSGIELIAELAALRHLGSPQEDRQFAIFGTRYAHGIANFSGAYSQRRIGAEPVEHLIALSIDWELDKGTEVSVGIGRELSSEGKSLQVGFSITKRFENRGEHW